MVGEVDPATLKPLVEKYIGSIPKGKKAPKWADNNDGPVKGIVEKVDPTKMETPLSTVFLNYRAPLAYSQEVEAALDVFSFVMDMRYVASLREEIGGTYGASTQGYQNKYPVERSTFLVQFQCKPELCDTLLTVAKRQLSEFITSGPTAEEFNNAVLNLKKNIPEKRITNNYWLREIFNVIEGYGNEDPEYEAAVNALTPEKVRAVAASIINSGNKVEYVMVPAE